MPTRDPDSAYTEVIDLLLAAGKSFKFTVEDMLKSLGLESDGCVAIDARGLKESLLKLEGEERKNVYERGLRLAKIKRNLDDMAPNDEEVHRQWIETKQPAFNEKTAKELILSGKSGIVTAFLKPRV